METKDDPKETSPVAGKVEEVVETKPVTETSPEVVIVEDIPAPEESSGPVELKEEEVPAEENKNLSSLVVPPVVEQVDDVAAADEAQKNGTTETETKTASVVALVEEAIDVIERGMVMAEVVVVVPEPNKDSVTITVEERATNKRASDNSVSEEEGPQQKKALTEEA